MRGGYCRFGAVYEEPLLAPNRNPTQVQVGVVGGVASNTAFSLGDAGLGPIEV